MYLYMCIIHIYIYIYPAIYIYIYIWNGFEGELAPWGGGANTKDVSSNSIQAL